MSAQSPGGTTEAKARIFDPADDHVFAVSWNDNDPTHANRMVDHLSDVQRLSAHTSPHAPPRAPRLPSPERPASPTTSYSSLPDTSLLPESSLALSSAPISSLDPPVTVDMEPQPLPSQRFAPSPSIGLDRTHSDTFLPLPPDDVVGPPPLLHRTSLLASVDERESEELDRSRYPLESPMKIGSVSSLAVHDILSPARVGEGNDPATAVPTALGSISRRLADLESRLSRHDASVRRSVESDRHMSESDRNRARSSIDRMEERMELMERRKEESYRVLTDPSTRRILAPRTYDDSQHMTSSSFDEDGRDDTPSSLFTSRRSRRQKLFPPLSYPSQGRRRNRTPNENESRQGELESGEEEEEEEGTIYQDFEDYRDRFESLQLDSWEARPHSITRPRTVVRPPGTRQFESGLGLTPLVQKKKRNSRGSREVVGERDDEGARRSSPLRHDHNRHSVPFRRGLITTVDRCGSGEEDEDGMSDVSAFDRWLHANPVPGASTTTSSSRSRSRQAYSQDESHLPSRQDPTESIPVSVSIPPAPSVPVPVPVPVLVTGTNLNLSSTSPKQRFAQLQHSLRASRASLEASHREALESYERAQMGRLSNLSSVLSRINENQETVVREIEEGKAAVELCRQEMGGLLVGPSDLPSRPSSAARDASSRKNSNSFLVRREREVQTERGEGPSVEEMAVEVQALRDQVTERDELIRRLETTNPKDILLLDSSSEQQQPQTKAEPTLLDPLSQVQREKESVEMDLILHRNQIRKKRAELEIISTLYRRINHTLTVQEESDIIDALNCLSRTIETSKEKCESLVLKRKRLDQDLASGLSVSSRSPGFVLLEDFDEEEEEEGERRSSRRRVEDDLDDDDDDYLNDVSRIDPAASVNRVQRLLSLSQRMISSSVETSPTAHRIDELRRRGVEERHLQEERRMLEEDSLHEQLERAGRVADSLRGREWSRELQLDDGDDDRDGTDVEVLLLDSVF